MTLEEFIPRPRTPRENQAQIEDAASNLFELLGDATKEVQIRKDCNGDSLHLNILSEE